MIVSTITDDFTGDRNRILRNFTLLYRIDVRKIYVSRSNK